MLVTVDTLRADYVSANGHSHLTTPFYDHLAASGVNFTKAYSSSSWTAPAMASLFTGLFPSSHGVTAGAWFEDRIMRQQPLDDSIPTLAEKLHEAGYVTVGIPSNRHLAKELGFAQGFDYYLDDASFNLAPKVNSLVRTELRRAFGNDWRTKWKQAKTFLWIHYFDPHVPYRAREPWIGEFAPGYRGNPSKYPAGASQPELNARFPRPGPKEASLIAPLYESEIRFWDDQFRQLSEELELDAPDVLLIVTSDHGEEIGDHGKLGHRHSLYQELVHVPLLIRWPRGLGSDARSRESLASLVDLYPTILELAAIDPPKSSQGQSLVSLLQDDAPAAPRTAGFELDQPHSSLVGITDGKWKFIRPTVGTKPAELYDLAHDPEERVNLAEKEASQTRQMAETIDSWLSTLASAPHAKPTAVPFDPQLQAELEALGYIDP